MADYDNVFETIEYYGAADGDDCLDIYGFVVPPYPIGFKTCRMVGVFKRYVNKVWDPISSGWVIWESDGGPDIDGSSYPGPSEFGSTSGFRFSGVRYR